ncbi:MAG: hypothetical protein HQL57_06000 [Magnetococcales bacterium]|nr:hypothetical protein [Magnetococcales bacterium]MBF0156720.1 hypothetical protein [Magnetococcales bacterium]
MDESREEVSGRVAQRAEEPGASACTGEADGLSPVAVQLQRRRRLLKGLVAGVPAIITMQSGAIAAAASSKNNCINTGSGFSALAANSINSSNGNARCGASTPDSYKYKYQTEAWFGGDVNGNSTPSEAGVNCLVYVDAAGTGAAAGAGAGGYGSASANGDPDTGYYAVTTSCWSSFTWT